MQRTENNEVNISFFVKELLQREVMAFVLDLARVSNMGDRQFEQFEKSVKDYIYRLIKNSNDGLTKAEKFNVSPTSDILPKVQSEKPLIRAH